MDFLQTVDPIILWGIKISLMFILVDTFFGWLLAFINGEFDISKAPKALATNVFPYIGGLIVLGVATTLDSNWEPLFEIFAGLISAKFGYEIIKEKILGFFKSTK